MSNNEQFKEKLVETADKAAQDMASGFSKMIIEIVKTTWNSAIEEAAKITKHSGYYEEIRKLKID